MEKFLITGGAGFLGSNLAKKLLSDGNKVVVMDNLFSGRKSHIDKLTEYPNFEFIQQDIRKPYQINVDAIFNLACPASPIHYQSDPIYTFLTSILGMENALQLAKKLSIPLVQASTSEVYGDPLESPQHENYWGNVNPIGIRACYDEGKRAAETLSFDYIRKYQTDVRVVRIFNTYGPGMRDDDGRVVSNFVTQALRGKNITVYGDGKQSRSFCYVDDLIDAMIKIMQLKTGLITPVNIGNPNEITMLSLAQKIISQTRSNSKIEFAELPSDDPTRRCPDISTAKHLLGWEPKTSLEAGLEKTIAYFEHYQL